MMHYDMTLRLRMFALFAALALPLLSAPLAQKQFDLVADIAARSLKEFSKQSGAEVLIGADLGRDVRTNRVKGEMTPREAMDALLRETGLVADFDESTNSFAVHRSTLREAVESAKLTNQGDSDAAFAAGGERRNHSALATLSTSQHGESIGEKVLELPSFAVSGKQVKGYRSSTSISGTKIATKIADLPFSVSVLTEEFIQDIAPGNIYDIVSYAANVKSNATGFNSGDTGLVLRGFASTPIRDGTIQSASANIYIDPSIIERVEVVKGPASLLYGPLGPGGVVNYVTKKPKDDPFITLTAQIGTLDKRRASIDVNQPIAGEKLLFRVNATWDEDFSWLEPSETKARLLMPSLLYKISPNLSFRAAYQWYKREETPPPYYRPSAQVSVTPESIVASLYQPGYTAPSGILTGRYGIDFEYNGANNFNNVDLVNALDLYPERFNYSANNNFRKYFMEDLSLEANVTLNSNWIARLNYNLNRNSNKAFQTGLGTMFLAPPDSLVYSNNAWSVAPAWAALSNAEKLSRSIQFALAANRDEAAMLATQNGTPAPRIFARRPRYVETRGSSDTFQFDLAGKIQFSWGTIQPLFGVNLTRNKGPHLLARQNNGASLTNPNQGPASPWFRTWDVNPASPTYYINHEEPISVSALTNLVANNTVKTTDKAAYAAVNGSLLKDRLNFVVGSRYNENRSQTYNFLNSSTGRDFRTDKVSPQAGLGFKITPDVMIYGSYSTSYQPSNLVLQVPGIVNGVQTSVPGDPAKPFEAVGYETGVKVDFLGNRLTATVALYETTLSDQVRTINPFVNGQTITISFQGAEQRSRGVELELNYSPTDNLQVLASLTFADTIDAFEPEGFKYFEGSQVPGAAQNLASLWARYNFTNERLRGFWIAGGAKYNGKYAGLTTSNVDYIISSFWDVNAAVGYDWKVNGKPWSVTLNINNLTDDDTPPSYFWFRLPRRAVLSMRTTF